MPKLLIRLGFNRGPLHISVLYWLEFGLSLNIHLSPLAENTIYSSKYCGNSADAKGDSSKVVMSDIRVGYGLLHG